MWNKFVTSDASLVLLASSSQCKPFLRDQVCHINYMIGKIFYNQSVTIWCGSPNASAQRSSRSPSFAPYLPVTIAPNCSPPPSRVPSTLPAVVKMLPLTDPSLIPGPKDSQMHSFDFSVLTESSLCKVLLTPLSAEFWTSLVTQMVKTLRAMQEIQDWPPGWGRFPLEKGNGYPLQYACLENSMVRGNWWATGHRVAKGWTQLRIALSYSLGALFSYLTKAQEIV